MPRLVFYRQLRRDGGIRTGVQVDGETVYGLIEEGEADKDPRLRWFVDLRCEGPKLPRTARGAKKWLLDQGDAISSGLARCAEEMKAGFDPDPDVYSISWADFENRPLGVTIETVVCAPRRDDALTMPAVLRDLGSRWDRIVRALKPPIPATWR